MASTPAEPDVDKSKAANAPPESALPPIPGSTGSPNLIGAPPSHGSEVPPPGQQSYSPPPGGVYPQYSTYPPQSYPLVYSGVYGGPGYLPPVGQYFPPPSSYYPPPPGQYPPPLPGQYPPSPSQYPAPLPGQYPLPSPGQYPPPSPGQHPPPSPGQYPPPSPGHYPRPLSAGGSPVPAGERATSPPPGVPPPGQYPGASPAGQYLSPLGAPLPAYPLTTPSFPGTDNITGQLPYHPAYIYPLPVANQLLWYLGTAIPDPNAPAATHGVQKVPGYDPALTFNTVVKAINNGNDTQLTAALLPIDVFKMDALRDYSIAKTGKSLQEFVDKNSSAGSTFGISNYTTALRALTLGPLWFDVDLAHKALTGLGTREMLLTELILGRSGTEIRLLIEGYRIKYGKDLVSAVKSDLSGKTERMFVMALNAQRPPDHIPVNHNEVAGDVETLHHASKKKEEVPFFEVLINRSNPHIAAVLTSFAMRYKSLSKVIKKSFSGHMQESLLYIVHGVKPKRDGQGFWRDAKLLEKSMAGLGTRDTQLIYRLVRAHWDPNRLEAVKDAYKRRYGKPLEGRVKGETSGEYQKLLVAIVKSSEASKF